MVPAACTGGAVAKDLIVVVAVDEAW